MRALITGATGFVGSALREKLLTDGAYVRAAVRRAAVLDGADVVVAGELHEANWAAALDGIDTVFHLASRVHVMRDTDPDPLSRYSEANVEGTVGLARASIAAGVKQFLFVSTVKVHGESSPRDGAFTERDVPRPQDPYSISKWDAERALQEIAAAAPMKVVTIRPPLVYGPGVRANFLALLRAVHRGLPLPLAAVDNRRSLIYVGNLASALSVAATRQLSGTFLVSDGEDLSTPELIRRIAKGMGRPSRIFPLPPALLDAAGGLTGKRNAVARLTESLRVDSSQFRARAGWVPPFTVDEGLAATVRWFSQCDRT